MRERFPFSAITWKMIKVSMIFGGIFIFLMIVSGLMQYESRFFVFSIAGTCFFGGLGLMFLGVGMIKPSINNYRENGLYIIPTKAGIAKTEKKFWLVFNSIIYTGVGGLMIVCGVFIVLMLNTGS